MNDTIKPTYCVLVDWDAVSSKDAIQVPNGHPCQPTELDTVCRGAQLQDMVNRRFGTAQYPEIALFDLDGAGVTEISEAEAHARKPASS